MTKLSTILDQVDAGSMLLPEFQRGYVWNRDQVRGLMRSLYLGYPVGALLVWETEGGSQAVRGGTSTAGQKHLLLDGQQRVTTLYGIVRGQPPAFFEGDSSAFSDLRFNVETEAFQFYGPVKMKDDPRWVDVTSLFLNGIGPSAEALGQHPDTQPKLYSEYVPRLQKLLNIAEKSFHAEQITGADKTVDVVVDIFNRVNSGGTKLSKGDLALARICSEWGDARPTMRRNLDRWAEKGFKFTADWLLRNTNAIATGRAPFSALEDVSATDFQHALNASLHHVDHLLYLLGSRLGIDHDRVLFGRYAIPVLARLLQNRGGRFTDGSEADKALYWFVHAALRGRFAGSTETFLAKDLETIDRSGIDGVIAALSRSRKGNMRIDAQDFEGVGRGARSYPLLYLLTRVRNGLDLVTGRVLGQESSSLEVHEIFPKALLAKAEAGYTRAELNAIGNFAFVGPASATHLAGADPATALAQLSAEARRSQWIPDDPELWLVENYREFLNARRELLAAALSDLLDELLNGCHPWDRELMAVVVSEEAADSDARASQISALLAEFERFGFTEPARDAEIADPESGRVLAVAELFWSDGLQAGQGKPVVLELDPEESDVPRLTELGCEVFTSVDALCGFVQRRSETESGDRTDGGTALPDGSTTLPDEVVPEIAPDTPADVDGPFDRAVLDLIQQCRDDLRYNPRYFRVMVTEYGALDATRRLLRTQAVSDGFVTLWERGRLDLTVEALVVDERFIDLFTEDERTIARKRLDDFGYAGVPA